MAVVGTPINVNLAEAFGITGDSPTFEALDTLPQGITLTPEGILSGTPVVVEAFRIIRIRISNAVSSEIVRIGYEATSTSLAPIILDANLNEISSTVVELRGGQAPTDPVELNVKSGDGTFATWINSGVLPRGYFFARRTFTQFRYGGTPIYDQDRPAGQDERTFINTVGRAEHTLDWTVLPPGFVSTLGWNDPTGKTLIVPVGTVVEIQIPPVDFGVADSYRGSRLPDDLKFDPNTLKITGIAAKVWR